MKQVRIGVIGIGAMGAEHTRNLLAGNVPRGQLAAICDVSPANLQKFPDVKHFKDVESLYSSGEVDAVIIATPHYFHTDAGIAALKAGLHVLVEKPLCVHKLDCEKLIAAHTNPKQVFSIMFNNRTNPVYQKIRSLVQSGELGDIQRLQWTITDWYRTNTYYAGEGWRASWAGEGGGTLVNQCPHNLDLFQWMFGMPNKIRAFCRFGHHHPIEVEDEVTAYLEYANGASGLFVCSTGEAPGTNRLEVACDRGRLVLENGNITFTRNEIPVKHFTQTSPERFAKPQTWDVSIPADGKCEMHVGIMKNFVEAILDGKPLIARGEEGIHSVELANAMIYSHVKNKTVDLPLDGTDYLATLNQLIEESKAKKAAGDRKTAPVS